MSPYLNLDGTAKEAVYFYEKALGGKVISVFTFGDMPADPNFPLSDEMKNRVMHAHLKVGESDLMFSDTIPGMPHQPGDTVNIALYPADEANARAIFAALKTADKLPCLFRRRIGAPCTGKSRTSSGLLFK